MQVPTAEAWVNIHICINCRRSGTNEYDYIQTKNHEHKHRVSSVQTNYAVAFSHIAWWEKNLFTMVECNVISGKWATSGDQIMNYCSILVVEVKGRVLLEPIPQAQTGEHTYIKRCGTIRENKVIEDVPIKIKMLTTPRQLAKLMNYLHWMDKHWTTETLISITVTMTRK